MLFPEAGLSRDQILQAVAQALQSSKSVIFLDASVLIHCYEMSAGARDELLGALERFGDRAKVPLWAARETWEWSIANVPKHPLRSHADRLRDQIALFSTEARRYVDDTTTRDLTKAEFETQLDAAARELLRLSGLVANHERRTDQTSDLLMPFIEQRRLNSNLAEISSQVARDAEVRAMQRIPPGYGDARADHDGSDEDSLAPEGRRERALKGKKRNRYGDQIIWQEILRSTVGTSFEELVFITQDVNKGDWVYKPRRIKDERGHLQENVGNLTLAHPLLVQEAVQHCSNLKRVHIISVATFALILRNYLSQPVSKLVAALQTDEEAAVRYGRARQAAGAQGVVAAAAASDGELVFRSTDLSYDPRGDSPLDGLIRQLAVQDWAVQNKAVQNLDPILNDANREQLVQLGRALAVAVNGSAIEALEFLNRVLADMERARQIRGNILIGVLASIYLNDAGDPRKPVATPDLTEVVFSFSGEEQLAPAYATILDRLQPQRRAYLGLPTDTVPRLVLTLGLDRQGATPVLRSVAVDKVDLLEEAAPESRRLSRSGQDELIPIEQLLFLLSREFVVPANFFQSDQTMQSQILVPSSTGFVRWGPGTGVILR
jgi:PIN like domain